MLFATLDPTMRAVTLPTGKDVILSDTVGFISDLPTQLVAAFRATLEEVLEADLIIHVRDIAHPETEEQARNVRSILGDLGVDEQRPLIELWNKADLLSEVQQVGLAARASGSEAVFLGSAVTGQGLDALFAAMTARLDDVRHSDEVVLDHSAGRARAWLYAQSVVESETVEEAQTRLQVNWTARQKRAFRALLGEVPSDTD